MSIQPHGAVMATPAPLQHTHARSGTMLLYGENFDSRVATAWHLQDADSVRYGRK
jgi:hypothetical protein